MWPLLFLLALVQEPVPVPIAGQPIAFAADHSGTCAPSTLTNCTVTYQLYVNGTKIGSEVPVSTTTPGVVKVTISGLSAGSHTARMTAIGRGLDATGKPMTVTSDQSAALTFTVLPGTPEPVTVEVPSNIRLEWPKPPPDLGDSLIDGQSNWILDGADDIEVDIPVSLQIGQSVLLASFQPVSGNRTYTATASNGMPLKLLGTAKIEGRGIHLWLGQPTVAGPVTLFVRANISSSFRASALIINTENVETVPWTDVPTVDSRTHVCGPNPWPSEHDGQVLCIVQLNASSTTTPTNAVWIQPTTGSFIGGWLVRGVGEEENGQIQFNTADGRRPFKIALRIW